MEHSRLKNVLNCSVPDEVTNGPQIQLADLGCDVIRQEDLQKCERYIKNHRLGLLIQIPIFAIMTYAIVAFVIPTYFEGILRYLFMSLVSILYIIFAIRTFSSSSTVKLAHVKYGVVKAKYRGSTMIDSDTRTRTYNLAVYFPDKGSYLMDVRSNLNEFAALNSGDKILVIAFDNINSLGIPVD